MKKVMLIVEAMLGGVRQHVFDITRELDRSKYEVYLIYSDDRADDKFFQQIGDVGKKVTLIKCNEMKRSISIHDIQAYQKIKKYIEDIQPDVVHCHSSKAGIVGRLAAKKCKVPIIIYTPHAYAFQSLEVSCLKRLLYIHAERYLSKRACTMTINVSKGEMKEALRNKIDIPEKFTLIYNGISDLKIPDKKMLREKLGFKEEIRYVGFTGRCAKQKNPMTFLHIAKNVIEKCRDIEFVYIGDGVMEKQMQEWIEENDLVNKIHMLGFRNDSAEVVGAFDVYLSTALYEGLPYSMIEAMRAGVPIIATNCVGNDELVVEGRNGFMFDIGDVEKGTKLVIKQLTCGTIDSNDVKETFVENFSLNLAMKRLMSIYSGNQLLG